MSAAAAAGEEWFGEMRVLRPDGEIRHTRASLATTRDADGVLTGYVSTLEDVTDEAQHRQQAERSLEARAAAERLIAETSRTLVTASVDDVDERVVAVLERMGRFVGADSAVLIGRASELGRGRAHSHAWYARRRRAGVGHGRRLADRHRGVHRLGHALVADRTAAWQP